MKAPWPVLKVAGEKLFQTIVSQMLVVMKREMPEPRWLPSLAARQGGGLRPLDGVATVPGRLGRQVDMVDLEVDDEAKDEDRGAEVHQVGQVLAVEGLLSLRDLVLAGGEQVLQG